MWQMGAKRINPEARFSLRVWGQSWLIQIQEPSYLEIREIVEQVIGVRSFYKNLINSVMIVLLFSYFNGFEIQGYFTIDRIV